MRLCVVLLNYFVGAPSPVVKGLDGIDASYSYDDCVVEDGTIDSSNSHQDQSMLHVRRNLTTVKECDEKGL